MTSIGVPSPSRDRVPCRYCGEMVLTTAKKCRFCDEYLDLELRKADSPSDFLFGSSIFPTDRPTSAIFAGYLGLFSLIPGFGIPALICGIIAIKKIRRNPELKGRFRAWFGVVMGSVFTLLYGLGLLGVIIGEMTR